MSALRGCFKIMDTAALRHCALGARPRSILPPAAALGASSSLEQPLRRGWRSFSCAPKLPCSVVVEQRRPMSVAASQGMAGKEGLPPPIGFPSNGKVLAAQAKSTNARMILTDAMALIYRSHFAFSADHRLRTHQGEDTTVLFGFLSTFISLMELQPRPTHLAVVFDASGKTFRHELFSGYKGHRPDTPPEVKAAVPKLREILRAMGVAELCVPGVEADDVIGTLSIRGVDDGMAVAIASPDKDFFQLLRPGLILLRPPRKAAIEAEAAAGVLSKLSKYALRPYTTENFIEEFEGLQPEQFVDVLALMGDSSDNVPGVAGIGKVTAKNLILQYGSLEAAIERAAEVKPKRAQLALSSPEGAAAAALSQQLVQIRTKLDMPPVHEPWDNFRVRVPADGGAEALRRLEELELKGCTRRLQALWRQWAEAGLR